MISFIYSTSRIDPQFELFIESLYEEICREGFNIHKIQLVFVDFHLQYDLSRLDYLKNIINNRFDFIHVCPMSSPWQGKSRITTKNMFCPSIARNTGICYAKYDYLVFMDDSSCIPNGTFKHIVNYANSKIVVAFAYQIVSQIKFENGETLITKFEDPKRGYDHRRDLGSNFRECHGQHLYGFASMPLTDILSINGYDELSNGTGQEDCHTGIRLMLAKIKIYYSSDVIMYKSTKLSPNEDNFCRVDFLLSDTSYTKISQKFNIQKRWSPGASKHISFVLLDFLMIGNSWSYYNDYSLQELRNKIKNGENIIENKKYDLSIKTFYGIPLKDIIDLWDIYSNIIPIDIA